MSPTEERIVALVAAARLAVELDPAEAVIDAETFLPEVLDSLALATLVAMIENEWHFEWDDELIEPEVFESLQSLAAFVDDVVASGA